MTAQELLGLIGKQPLPRVMLFAPGKAPFGKEPWEPQLAERCIQKILDVTLEPGMADLAYTALYADEVPVSQVVMEAQTLPFLTDLRIVLVRNAERYFGMSGGKGSQLNPLLEYLKSPNETTILMLVSNKSDKRVAFYTACQKAGEIVECPQLDDRQLGAWVNDAAAALGKRLDRNALNELIERAGSRISDVENALKLVSAYVGASDSIREEDVRAACADVAEESIWALTDAIAQSDPEKALKTLYQLQEFGKSADEIMGTINWLLESAYRASPTTSGQLKSQFQVNKVKPLLDKFGLEKLIDALALCTNTHFMIRSTGVDTDLALEMLVIKLAYRAKAKARR